MMPTAPVHPYDDCLTTAAVAPDDALDADAQLARRLQQEERDAEMARNLEARLKRQLEIQLKSQQQERDAIYAQNLEQELRDEDVARQLAAAEEAALRQSHLGPALAARATPTRRRRLCQMVVPCILALLVVAAVLFVVRPFDQNGDGTIIPGLPPLGWDNDPFVGLGPDEVAKWRNNGNGLRLTILNALDGTWQSTLNEVVQDWDNGTPDCLELEVDTATPDPDCPAKDGQSKVCNGDYGATDWRGLNSAIMQWGYITASVSRVNEFYLKDASEAQRRYTLCHELGHSFGLPHSDENFYNADLGNCMDYTTRPQNNQSPDETNFQFLFDLYGALSGSSEPLQAALPVEQVVQDENFDDGDNDNGRLLRRQRRQLGAVHSSIPQHVLAALDEAERDLMHSNKHNRQHGRKLQLKHASTHHETYHLDLEDGWSLRFHKSLAN